MDQHQNIPVLPQTQTTNYQISCVADTLTNKKEEEDPDDDYNPLLSDLSMTFKERKSSSSSFSPITTDAEDTYDYSNIITPMKVFGNTIKELQPSGNQSPTQSSIACSTIFGFPSFNSSLEAAMLNESKRDDKEMAKSENSESSEKSFDNATVAAKPDKDDLDGQYYKKQYLAEPYNISRAGEKRKIRSVKNQRKSRLFLSERSKLYEFSQSNRILLVIPSSQSAEEESIIVHKLHPTIEAADAEILRVYDHIVKDYPNLIIETEKTETTISYKLHELVPFSVELCREMVVKDGNNQDKLGVRSAVLRDGSLDKVFANCIRIITNEYVNNITQFIIVESFLF
jgi:hypothetical protein